MKAFTHIQKDLFVRSLAGYLIIVFLIMDKAFDVDTTFFILFIGCNLFQYGLTGWCPFASYFMKIGWLQNDFTKQQSEKNMNEQSLNTTSQSVHMPSFINLAKKFNFEFMDLKSLPNSLRSSLRDILEVGNGAPFRNYYKWVSTSVHDYAQKHNLHEIVELGAGCAPITKNLISRYPDWEASFKITDLNPDIITFDSLAKEDHRVKAIYEAVDFSKSIEGFDNSLLVLSATFHHIDETNKKNILNNLKKLSPHIMIFEPLRPTALSFLFVFGALFTGFLTPIFRLNSKNFLRNFLWCWLVPIAPLIFLWDGWVSAFRSWSKQKWLKQESNAAVEESVFCTKVVLCSKGAVLGPV